MNKLKSTTVWVMIAVLSLLATACKKNKTEEVENEVTITLMHPNEGDTVASMVNYMIHGSINATQEIHGYRISLRDELQQVYLDTTYDVHATSLTIHEMWMNQVVDTAKMTLTVDVVKDHEGNHQLKTVHFVALP